jgi:hypothetical protein
MMGRVVAWLGEKLIDKAFDCIVGGLAGLLAWLIYSPIWGGWRAVGIGVCVSGIAMSIIAIRRRETKVKSGDHQRQQQIANSIASLDPSELKIVSAFGQSQQNTRELAFDDPVVAGLLAKGVLVFASVHGRLADCSNGEVRKMFPMMLSMPAKKCLANTPVVT